MTLRIDARGKVIKAPCPASVHDEPPDVVPLSEGQNGLLLHTLTRLCANMRGVGSVVGGTRQAMPDDWEQKEEVIAAGTSCPMPDCGALTVAYRSTDGVRRDHSEHWEFTCPRCGIDFTVPEDELIFQSVPKDWLLASVHAP